MEGKWSITPDELSTLVKERDNGGDPSEKIVSKYGGVLELAKKLQVDVKLGLREQSIGIFFLNRIWKIVRNGLE